ncbi:MAG: IS110 family transposase [Chloroflexi bacterium]|nr:MAG: IS110 family transposase [Chloroflexota bacterium]
MSIVHPNAAGLDIGKEEIFVAVPAERDPYPVRSYATFTPDLHALADWLQHCQVDTVAMESTGVYWIPLYELLEQRGIRCFLINAAHLKRVPGRKSDVQDCQWLQQCHSFGLLAGSFRPDAEMVQLRTYLRHRAELIERRAPYVLHMQKALHQMNIQLDVVLSNIMGDTGQAILRSILRGERDPVKLAQLRHPSCHSSQETIAKALTGAYRDDYLFALKQAVELYDYYTTKIAECDAQVERCFSAIKPRFAPAQPAPTERKKKNSNSRNEPASNTRQHLFRITGLDLVAIDGFSNSIAQTVFAEVGVDMSRWPTPKHFASWLGLSPHNEISGGKILRSKTHKTRNRAAQAFRLAARDSALGAFYRRLKARIGPQQALTATAHKIARIYYAICKNRQPFEHVTAETYQQQFHERELKYLRRKAAKLGFVLAPKPDPA